MKSNLVHKSLFYNTKISLQNALVCFLARIKLIAYLFCIRYRTKMRIVHIFRLLQVFLWVDFIFRHINSSKSYSGGFLSTWRPNRKSFENQAHFVSLSETSVHHFLCGQSHSQSRPQRPSDLIVVRALDYLCAGLTSAKPKLVSRPYVETVLKLCDLIRLDQIARSRGRNIVKCPSLGMDLVVKSPPPARTLPPRGLH